MKTEKKNYGPTDIRCLKKFYLSHYRLIICPLLEHFIDAVTNHNVKVNISRFHLHCNSVHALGEYNHYIESGNFRGERL